jgi:hypothetical protein
MQIAKVCRTWWLGLLLPVAAALAQGGDDKAQLAQLEAQLLSSWWGTVEGERDPRIMRITRIGPRADGHFGLDINYGIAGVGQGPLKAALYRQSPPSAVGPQEWIGSKTFKIEFSTQAGTLISAESAAAGTFVGTFALRSGASKSITLERVSEDEVRARLAGANGARKAAAEKWLAKDTIKIDYDGAYKSTFTVDMKARTVVFYGNNDYCAQQGAIPATAQVDERGMLVFVFRMERAGCPDLQYSFDPISRVGSIRLRPGNAAPNTPWGAPSGSKVSLVSD